MATLGRAVKFVGMVSAGWQLVNHIALRWQLRWWDTSSCGGQLRLRSGVGQLRMPFAIAQVRH